MKSDIQEMLTSSDFKITDQQQVFAETYLQTYNAQEAMRVAFPGENMRLGYVKLRLRGVAEYIRLRREEEMEVLCIDTTRVLSEIGALAFTDITDVVEWDTGKGTFDLKEKKDLTTAQRKSIRKITMKRTPSEFGDRVEIAVEMHDKLKAIDTLNKHLNVLTDAKTLVQVNNQNNVTIDATQLSVTELQKLVEGSAAKTIGE